MGVGAFFQNVGASKIGLAVFEEVPKAETNVDKVAAVGIASTISRMFPNKSADIENTSVCMDEKCRTLSKTFIYFILYFITGPEFHLPVRNGNS